MNSIKCAQCGFINWVTDGACRRCGRPLGFIEEVSGHEAVADAFETAAPSVSAEEEAESVCSFCGTRSFATLCPVCRKALKPLPSEQPVVKGPLRRFFSSGHRVAAAMIVVALAVTGVTYAVAKRRANEVLDARAKAADLIREFGAFTAPVSFSFMEESSELQPGVRVLMERGLVSYRVGTTPTKIHYEETDKETGEIVRREKENPDGGRTYARVELTARGFAESAHWKRELAGWNVPVGGRALVEVREVVKPRRLSREEWEKLPRETRALVSQSDEVSSVAFAWRWTPDQLGNYFDAKSDDHRALSPEARASAGACRLEDSAKIRTGTALLVQEKDGLSVRAIVFN